MNKCEEILFCNNLRKLVIRPKCSLVKKIRTINEPIKKCKTMFSKINFLVFKSIQPILTIIFTAQILCINSCNSINHKKYLKIQRSYINATRVNFLWSNYISVPIDTIKDEGRNPELHEYAVLLAGDLFNILQKTREFKEVTFANNLLNLFVRKQYLYLSSSEYLSIKPFLISREDARKYSSISTKALYKKYHKNTMEKGSIGNCAPSDYLKRCAIHHFFQRGYDVILMDDTGELFLNQQ